MRDYATTRSCRMAFLRALLDDRDASACGRCDNCTGVHLQAGLDPHDVSDAIGHIRSQRLVIAPRKRWPPGMQPTPPKIVPLEEGRALSVYGDGAWGSVVKAYKQRGVPFPQELLSAAAALVRSWRPQPIPTWVTAVPSTTASGLIADAASRLAAELGLPFTPVLARTRAAPPQKEMENSQQQVRNVYGAFMAVAPVPTGAVLLVDDIFDSGWTLTVAGQLLLQAGSGPVHPLVLAQASGD